VKLTMPFWSMGLARSALRQEILLAALAQMVLGEGGR
jgi:hypothetical protein